MSKVSVGTDPEALLYDLNKERIVPACGLIGGTKAKPIHFNKDLEKGFTIQEDNVAVEFNIPPAFTRKMWMEHINTAITAVNEFIKSKGDYIMMFRSEHIFPFEELQSEGAQTFGCSPDFDAYQNGDQCPRIDRKELVHGLGEYRLQGGHVHVGFTADVPLFVSAAFADYFIGLRTCGEDMQAKRRGLYGQPGRYRPTAYGLEYRTPSNYWLANRYQTSAIGEGAFALANFLSKAPVSVIKRAYQSLPWGAVRKAITEQDTTLVSTIYKYISEEQVFSGWSDDEEGDE